jgi:serine/threonine protein kinase
MQRAQYQTGSNFSVGYVAEHPQKGSAFLKALDFWNAFNQEDQIAALQKATADFQFEAEILKFCRDKDIRKVVKVLDSGDLNVAPESIIGRVYYILFEHSAGDIRKEIHELSNVDEETAVSILHEVSIGLTQIHRNQIAHQDIKPSNILAFSGKNPYRLTDFGTSSTKPSPGPRDALQFPGSKFITPPEALYGFHPEDWSERRLLADFYALGSLAVFLYAGHHLNSLLLSAIDENYQPGQWQGSYLEVMPVVQRAYAHTRAALSEQFSTDVGKRILTLVDALSDPDPKQRGWRKYKTDSHRRFTLDPFVSQFGSLRKRASINKRVHLRDAQ